MNQESIRKGTIVKKTKATPGGVRDVFYHVEWTTPRGCSLKPIQNGKIQDYEVFVWKKTLKPVKVVCIEVSIQQLKRIKTQYFPGWVEHEISKQWENIIDENPDVIKFYNVNVKAYDYVYCKYINAKRFIRVKQEKLMNIKQLCIRINADVII